MAGSSKLELITGSRDAASGLNIRQQKSPIIVQMLPEYDYEYSTLLQRVYLLENCPEYHALVYEGLFDNEKKERFKELFPGRRHSVEPGMGQRLDEQLEERMMHYKSNAQDYGLRMYSKKIFLVPAAHEALFVPDDKAKMMMVWNMAKMQPTGTFDSPQIELLNWCVTHANKPLSEYAYYIELAHPDS